jgi:hypothetical protein
MSFLAQRYADAQAQHEPSITFAGVFPEDPATFDRLLIEAIERKLRYGRYGGTLILLVFSRERVEAPPSRAARSARQFLQSREHSFDEAWFTFPYPGAGIGSIERLFP